MGSSLPVARPTAALDGMLAAMIERQAGRPCPTQRDVMALTGIGRSRVWPYFHDMAARGLIEIEVDAGDRWCRRLRVTGGQWTGWTARNLAHARRKDEIREKKRRFVAAYLVKRNARQAALAAGYAFATAARRAYQFLREPEVAAAIAEHDRALTARLEIAAEQVLRQTARLAFADCRKLFNTDGSLKPPHELDEDTAAALTVLTHVRHAGGGERRKIRMAGKLAALTKLGRYFGLFTKKHAGEREDLADRIAAARKRVK